MKKTFYFLLLPLLAVFSVKASAAPTATLTTATIAAANINQGTTYSVVYAAKMKVTVSAVTINNIKFTLTGNYDNGDLTYAYIYFNASAPVISGASYLGYTAATYSGPHAYSLAINKAMTVNDEGYFIVAVSLNSDATDNHTIQVNGATNPVVFGYSVGTNVVNNQSNKAGVQTIQAADITLTSAVVALANINQGTTYNVVYAAKIKVLTEPVTVNNIQFTLSGNHDNSDLTNAYLYYNASAPVISGASYLGYTAATYSAPHNYSINVNKAMAAGDQGFFIVAVSLTSNATDNHTIVVNGATDPMKFGFVTDPNVTNTQTDKAKKQIIQAADITLTSAIVALANINQGTTYNVVYAAKMKVLTEPVTVNNIQFTLSGNHDNSDLTNAYLYYNASAPDISGASYLGYTAATYSAPHNYSVNVNKAMAAGDQGFFIVAVSLTSNATDNHTIVVNGATDPMKFGFVTDPNVTNTQTDKAKKQIIQAADITLTSAIVALANINQGTTYNVVYAAKMKVLTEPVTVNNIQFTLSGNHDNSDLTNAYLYYNASAPVISGASYLGYTAATYSAPHDYSINVNKAMAAGDQGFFIVAVSLTSNATDNHTIVVNGATDPMKFGFVTDPNVTNTQTDKAKKQIIQAADITLTSAIVALANINQGTTYNVVYAAKMKVLTEPVTVNNIQFTLSGNHDNSDLTNAYLYYNASAPVISGASYLGYTAATYSAPHDYSINVNKAMAAGDQGFFIVAVSLTSNATDNHTIVVNGATDPMKFGFVTDPNVTNTQTDKAKKQIIQAADITLTSANIAAGNIGQGSTYNVVYAAKMKVLTEPATVNNIQFTLSGNHDNSDLTNVYLYYNASSPVISGASYLGYTAATYAAPHDYSVNINKAMAAGDEGFFIVAVSLNASASIGKTVKINGATNPMEFGFATDPNVTNNQSNSAGTKTIVASFGIAGNSKAEGDAVVNKYAITNIFPNPTSSVFNFTVKGKEPEIILAQLTNRSGHILLSKKIAVNNTNLQFSIPVSSVTNGTYYLVLVNSSGNIINRQEVNIQH